MVEDNECLCTIEEIASLFGTKAKHRGFLRASGAKIHSNRGGRRWCGDPIQSIHYVLISYPKIGYFLRRLLSLKIKRLVPMSICYLGLVLLTNGGLPFCDMQMI